MKIELLSDIYTVVGKSDLWDKNENLYSIKIKNLNNEYIVIFGIDKTGRIFYQLYTPNSPLLNTLTCENVADEVTRLELLSFMERTSKHMLMSIPI